jgi:hypothetical protein
MSIIQVIVDVAPLINIINELAAFAVPAHPLALAPLPSNKTNVPDKIKIQATARLKLYYGTDRVNGKPANVTIGSHYGSQPITNTSTVTHIPFFIPSPKDNKMPTLYRLQFQLTSNHAAPLEWYSRNFFTACSKESDDKPLPLSLQMLCSQFNTAHTDKFHFFRGFDIQLTSSEWLSLASRNDENNMTAIPARRFENLDGSPLEDNRRAIFVKI